jgi:hypothetical protein
MSLRYEQQNALVKTQRLLRDILTVYRYPKTKKEMRERAYRCLKHFPFLDEYGAPMFSRDEFECPKINDDKRFGEKDGL